MPGVNNENRYLAVIAGSLLVMVAGLLTYLFSMRTPGNISLPVVEGCLLQLDSCSTALPGGGELVFEITPRQPVATDPLDLRVDFQGIEPQAVGVRFKGEDMAMGYLENLRYPLAKIDTDNQSILFEGQGGVFACSTGMMKWLVFVDVEVDGVVYEVPFKFETGN